MSRRAPTILDDLFPDTAPEFTAIADAWQRPHCPESFYDG